MMSDQIDPGSAPDADGPIALMATTARRTALAGPLPGVVSAQFTVVVHVVVERSDPSVAEVIATS